jgi:saccharopine dehydrogenase-like NADP-dependent oxidoreductase
VRAVVCDVSDARAARALMQGGMVVISAAPYFLNLELAKAAKIDVLVTGDKDLLSLSAQELKGEGLQRLKIMTPKDFIADFSDVLG